MRFSIGGPPVQTAARWLLTTALPTQEMVGALSSITHDFCIIQAKEILWNDGHESEALQVSFHHSSLSDGVRWIDQGWRNIAHYYHPVRGRGLFGGSHAVHEIGQYYHRALRLFRRHKTDQAMFFLGAACHFVQDLCVPHHAKCAIFSGHREFEQFAEEHRREYAVSCKGLYDKEKRPESWVEENARIAYDWFPHVEGKNSSNYDRALQTLLPLAQQTTAGFLKNFFDEAKQ
ncbi:zinc dependent phospholipase C family protein [Heliobacterium chlorum]|uniref:Phospholipase C n=1 Tax=Heliobacterium chlorum TaxID=2698 RepID=A0ABR7T5U5_HELCL|nr:zinc dependent phospholipase C family protein [Heliobacterium chlorum]